MHSSLAIEKYAIRVNLGINGVTSLLLLLRRLADSCLTTLFGTNGHLSGIAIREKQYSPLIK